VRGGFSRRRSSSAWQSSPADIGRPSGVHNPKETEQDPA
jgi:hypothetical protein